MGKKIAILFSCIILAFFVGMGVVWAFFLPTNSNDTHLIPFTISKNESVLRISQSLANEGFIRSSILIKVLLLVQPNKAVKIQTGMFELTKSMTVLQILSVLTHPPQAVWITLLEGWRVEEMAQVLSQNLNPQFFSASQFVGVAQGDEGMLFPDTYLISKDASASSVLGILHSTFNTRFASLITTYGTPSNTPEHVVILASIVQREARTLPDMQMVAGILENRLRLHMPLQSDVTVRYAKGYDPINQSWWNPPTAADTHIDSPFNTYRITGLPPAAICNPGTNALIAALHPTQSDYLFYLADLKGVMHYAKTLAEHDALIQRYLR